MGSDERAPGKLWAVGLGPGDSELVTFKAARAIERADVVAFHCARHGRSIALSVAQPYLRDGQIHERLVYPYQGREFRLTDVAGHVVDPILA